MVMFSTGSGLAASREDIFVVNINVISLVTAGAESWEAFTDYRK